MTFRIIRRPQVEQDLVETYTTIHADQSAAAEAFLDAAEQSIKDLAHWPYAGVAIQWMSVALPGLRKINVKRFSRYLIFYIVHERERQIEIIRVLHGSRDLSPELRRSIEEDWPS